MTNTISITHAADMDGIFSAALVMMKYGISTENVCFTDYGVKSSERALNFVKEKFKENGTLVITDLGMNKSTEHIVLEVIKHVRSKNGKIFWFDHHNWSDHEVETVATLCDNAVVGENEKFCAAEITAVELGMKGPFIEEMLKVVHKSDFNLKPDNAEQLKIIKSYAVGMASYSELGHEGRIKKIREIAEHVVNEKKLLPEFLVKDTADFEKIEAVRLKELAASMIKSGNIAIGFTTYVSTNTGCELLISKSKGDIGIFINTAVGKAHLRSKKSDCSKIAVAFGGGGHPHACGFEIDKKKYDLDSQKGKEKIANEIIECAKKLALA